MDDEGRRYVTLGEGADRIGFKSGQALRRAIELPGGRLEGRITLTPASDLRKIPEERRQGRPNQLFVLADEVERAIEEGFRPRGWKPPLALILEQERPEGSAAARDEADESGRQPDVLASENARLRQTINSLRSELRQALEMAARIAGATDTGRSGQ